MQKLKFQVMQISQFFFLTFATIHNLGRIVAPESSVHLVYNFLKKSLLNDFSRALLNVEQSTIDSISEFPSAAPSFPAPSLPSEQDEDEISSGEEVEEINTEQRNASDTQNVVGTPTFEPSQQPIHATGTQKPSGTTFSENLPEIGSNGIMTNEDVIRNDSVLTYAIVIIILVIGTLIFLVR